MKNDESKNEGFSPISVSVKDAARMLGVSPPTVYTLIHREGFPSFKVGHRTLISVEGLQKWVQEQTRTA